MTKSANAKRYLRQLGIFNPAKHGSVPVHIIGAGGIGSFTAIALAKLGMEDITVWDGDDVEEHNIPNQFHPPNSLGDNKALALAETVERLTGTKINPMADFWSPKLREATELSGVVISAVDHMEATKANKNVGRRELWKYVKENVDVRLFVDGRLGGQAIRVLAIRPLADALRYEWFEKRMFPQEQAKELPCTQRGIIDVGFAVSALITRVVRKYLVTDKLSEFDVTLDMDKLALYEVRPQN